MDPQRLSKSTQGQPQNRKLTLPFLSNTY